MAQKGSGPPGGGEDKAPTPIELREALEDRYLRYALSTITGRALPDARDGLKPVHRRILYGMHILRLDPGSPFKKCAKIVGDVMGSFHPHGDQAIYDALVRLAQDFSSRYPLVDGQGNFGNVDGDSAAAYRYTEARMTAVARLLLEGIDDDAIDFKPNYSGEEEEPIVLPAALPNLLANGSQGIAVGMATSVPPHNVAELCDAALYLIGHRTASAEQLLTFVQGPDFPTGGIVVDKRADIIETYRTGRGSFRLRARWNKEEQPRGGWVAVVTEIPYGVQKSRLIERLAELVMEKKLPLVADVRDEFGGGCPHRLRTSREKCRSGADDGDAVQALRTGDALRRQYECAGRWRHAARRLARRGAAAMARSPPRGAAAPLAPSADGDPAPARTARRDARRLSQSRRGDPHHQRGGRRQEPR